MSKFIQHNNKIQVTKNINANLEKSLQQLKKDIAAKHFAAEAKSYASVMTNCLACHTVIRGW